MQSTGHEPALHGLAAKPAWDTARYCLHPQWPTGSSQAGRQHTDKRLLLMAATPFECGHIKKIETGACVEREKATDRAAIHREVEQEL